MSQRLHVQVRSTGLVLYHLYTHLTLLRIKFLLFSQSVELYIHNQYLMNQMIISSYNKTSFFTKYLITNFLLTNVSLTLLSFYQYPVVLTNVHSFLPDVSVLASCSSCANGSNTCGINSSLIPIPVSLHTKQ